MAESVQIFLVADSQGASYARPAGSAAAVANRRVGGCKRVMGHALRPFPPKAAMRFSTSLPDDVIARQKNPAAMNSRLARSDWSPSRIRPLYVSHRALAMPPDLTTVATAAHRTQTLQDVNFCRRAKAILGMHCRFQEFMQSLIEVEQKAEQPAYSVLCSDPKEQKEHGGSPSTKDDSASNASPRPATRMPFMTSSSSCSSCGRPKACGTVVDDVQLAAKETQRQYHLAMMLA